MVPDFPPLPFDQMSEADVREDVLVPLISALGYRTGTRYDVRRELTLRYPRQSLGRKQPSRDPQLRGRADYVLKVEGRLSWVLEAKSPVADIGTEEIEQAWTYACHPEVRAAYFALCNGHELKVFDTLAAPEAPAILVVRYEDFNARFTEVLSLLGPHAIERSIARRELSLGTPLGPGLGSVAQVASGLIRYASPSVPGSVMPHLQTIVLGGAVERDEQGKILVHLDTQAPLPGMQAINERIGFRGVDLSSQSHVLSVDPSQPMVLTGAFSFTLPKGEEIPNPANGTKMQLTMDLACEVQVTARGTLQNDRFVGEWSSHLRITSAPINPISLGGEFFVRLV